MENSSRSSLVKILELEQKLGYTDRAVIGGLDKFVKRWADSFSGFHPDFTMAAGLNLEIEQDLEVVSALKLYRQSSIEERKNKVEKALRLLRGETVTIPAPALAETTPRRGTATWDSLPSASKPSNNWVWAVVIALGLIVLYLNGFVNATLLKLVLAAGLIYLINRVTAAPYTSKRGEKAWLYHGPLVSARWKERSDRKVDLFWLWVILFVVLVSLFQQ